MPSRPLQHKTPFQILFDKPPIYLHLRVFGCRCFASTHHLRPHKFDARSVKCVFIGYPSGTKSYKLYDISKKKSFISRDVINVKRNFLILKLLIFLHIPILYPCPYFTTNQLYMMIRYHLLPIITMRTPTPPPLPPASSLPQVPPRRPTQPTKPSTLLRDFHVETPLPSRDPTTSSSSTLIVSANLYNTKHLFKYFSTNHLFTRIYVSLVVHALYLRIISDHVNLMLDQLNVFSSVTLREPKAINFMIFRKKKSFISHDVINVKRNFLLLKLLIFLHIPILYPCPYFTTNQLYMMIRYHLLPIITMKHINPHHLQYLVPRPHKITYLFPLSDQHHHLFHQPHPYHKHHLVDLPNQPNRPHSSVTFMLRHHYHLAPTTSSSSTLIVLGKPHDLSNVLSYHHLSPTYKHFISNIMLEKEPNTFSQAA
ncbi:hypothetical protein V2J09_020195 [Rumex salicifolius]